MDIRNLGQIIGDPLDRPRNVNQHSLADSDGKIVRRVLCRDAGGLRSRRGRLSPKARAGAEE
jgi:hypothetical protein